MEDQLILPSFVEYALRSVGRSDFEEKPLKKYLANGVGGVSISSTISIVYY